MVHVLITVYFPLTKLLLLQKLEHLKVLVNNG